MSISIGEVIQYKTQIVKVISAQTISGETYLDVLIKPAGPIRYVLLKDIESTTSCPIRRERHLCQFNDYLREATAGQKFADVRKEAILTGFEEAYRAKRYQDIITVGGRLNQSLGDSSTEIFDFIDIAEEKIT